MPLGPQPHADNGIGHVATAGLASKWDISYKPNEALRKFDGNSAHYKIWADRMLDHLCRGNTKWRATVTELQTCPDRILKDWLTHQWIDGQNGWDLSAKLETFIADWVADNIDTRRVQLAGGEYERGIMASRSGVSSSWSTTADRKPFS
jgi:hypothetical protein